MPTRARYEVDLRFQCPGCRDVSERPSIVDVFADDGATCVEGVFSSVWTAVFCSVCNLGWEAILTSDGKRCSGWLAAHSATVIGGGSPTLIDSETFGRHDEAPAKDPYARFIEATGQIEDVLRTQGSGTDGSHIVNRMVFAQHISAFEAYLADALIATIEKDAGAIRKLIATDKKLGELRFGLGAIVDDPDIVERVVRSYLRNVVYHRLHQVNAIYLGSLGIQLLLHKADSDAIIRAVECRHHCVHRNGFDLEGRRLQIFTPDYIGEIATILAAMVERVQAAIDLRQRAEVPPTP